jgi:hypothetical protein
MSKWACKNGALTTLKCCTNSFGCIQTIELNYAEGTNASVSCDTCSGNTTVVALLGDRVSSFTVAVNTWAGAGSEARRQCVANMKLVTSSGRTLTCGSPTAGSGGRPMAGGRALLAVEESAPVTVGASEDGVRTAIDAALLAGSGSGSIAASIFAPLASAGRSLLTASLPRQPINNSPNVPACMRTQGKKQNRDVNCFLCGLNIKRCRTDPSGTKSINRMLPVWACDLNTGCPNTPPLQWSCNAPIQCTKGGDVVKLQGTCTTDLAGSTVQYSLDGAPIEEVTCPDFGQPSLEVVPFITLSSSSKTPCTITGPPVEVNPPKKGQCLDCCPNPPVISCNNVPTCADVNQVVSILGACTTDKPDLFDIKYTLANGEEVTEVTCPAKGAKIDITATPMLKDPPTVTEGVESAGLAVATAAVAAPQAVVPTPLPAVLPSTQPATAAATVCKYDGYTFTLEGGWSGGVFWG